MLRTTANISLFIHENNIKIWLDDIDEITFLYSSLFTILSSYRNRYDMISVTSR